MLSFKKKNVFLVLVIIFSFSFCGDSGNSDGGDENVYTGILKVKISYKEPLKDTRLIKIWVIKSRDINQDCMIPSLQPDTLPYVAYTEIEYSEDDYNSQVEPEWQTQVLQETYTIMVRGFDSDNNLVSIGCNVDIFVPGEASRQASVSLYYAN